MSSGHSTWDGSPQEQMKKEEQGEEKPGQEAKQKALSATNSPPLY